MSHQQALLIKTHNRGAIEITQLVNAIVDEFSQNHTLCHVFVTHTSASLMITGNEDADVLLDIEDYFQDVVKDAIQIIDIIMKAISTCRGIFARS